MNRSAMTARIARSICAAGLALGMFFWTVVLIRLITGFSAGGIDGARGNLHRMILVGSRWGQIDRDPVGAISRGYEGLILCLLLTWSLREMYTFVRKKLG